MGGSYPDLFIYALRKFGILCIGVYRYRDISCTLALNPSAKRYVVTNPPDDFRLLPTDKVRHSPHNNIISCQLIIGITNWTNVILKEVAVNFASIAFFVNFDIVKCFYYLYVFKQYFQFYSDFALNCSLKCVSGILSSTVWNCRASYCSTEKAKTT